MDLPQHVQCVITQLVADPSVYKIWLIGSQINGVASPQSDWDLLVFANREPDAREARCRGVDVIWKGPTKTLLEGQLGSQQLDFNNFRWTEGDDGTAEYVGCKSHEFELGVAHDASATFAS